ncbi:chorismate-binding protein [Candidatus Carsonella ruddii]|uniref:chorismate-binding protein n=1 Tax=Carsonella ruddii TaxID=114186 RepID=UPI003D461A82
MIFHRFKKIFLFKKIFFSSIIKKFLFKKFFFLEKKNTIFIINFNFNYLFNNIFKIKNFFIINKNINNYFKKKIYNNKTKFRFLNSFFSFINFNYFKNNIKKYNDKNYYIFFPTIIFLLNKINKKIILFCIIKKINNFKKISKCINFYLLKINNYKNIFFLYKKKKNINFFIKKNFFFKNICKIKKTINIGNLTQCVISNIIYIKNFNIQKKINFTFYNFYFNFKNFITLVNSPEFLIRKENTFYFTKPIAGTSDKYFHIKKILKNKKEISEHLMLLDLSLNDIFKNNIKKYFLKKIFFCEKIKNLTHIISEIVFTCYNNNFQLFKNMFPAGTLSGSPKNNSIKYINILEKKSRFIYGGLFIYINKKHIESCIMIRMKNFLNNNCIIESGAGIIDKSINYLEWLETIIKKQEKIK